MKFRYDKNGSALLVALLVMGVLISISLALSTLILREIRITGEALDSGRAYYSAESGIEVALYNLNNQLPGWETENKDYVLLKIDDEYRSVAEYKVDNTCTAYPCFDSGFEFDSLGDKDFFAYYDVLGLNQSITIPLFVVKNGVEVPVSDFTVEFFAPFNPMEDFNDELKATLGANLQGWDILRWKIFGLSENGGQKFTESISDFTALSKVNYAVDDKSNFSTNAKNPSWFGSVSCSGRDVSDKPRYEPDVECIGYSGDTQMIYDSSQKSAIYAGICDNKSAREYYDYSGDREIDSEDIKDCYPIGDFLSSHSLNYLTLTNLMNPSVFDSGLGTDVIAELSKLYFRVELFSGEAGSGNQTVREYADITSNGYSGDSKRSINVKIKRGSFMPVFNFSLYSTYKAGEKL